MPEQKKEIANLHLALVILFIIALCLSRYSSLINFGVGIGLLVLSVLIFVRGKGVEFNRVPNIVFLCASLIGSIAVNLLMYFESGSPMYKFLGIITVICGLTGFISIFLIRRVYVELKQSAKNDLLLTNDKEPE